MNDHSKKTCIIIEDNPAFVKVLEQYIKRLEDLEIVGCFHDSIGSAMSISRYQPDLIFLDIGISGLTGLEMLETVNYKPKTIVISNHSPDYLEFSDSEVKVDAFMQKPIQFDQFEKVVNEVLKANTVEN